MCCSVMFYLCMLHINLKRQTEYECVYSPPLRDSVSAVHMWRVWPVTHVNLCTGICLLTLLKDAPVRNASNTRTNVHISNVS